MRTGFNYAAASCLDELATELTGSTPSEIRTLGFDCKPAGQITERTDTGGNYAFAGHTNQTTAYDHNALNLIIEITETGAVTRTLTPQWTAGNLRSYGVRVSCGDMELYESCSAGARSCAGAAPQKPQSLSQLLTARKPGLKHQRV